LYQLDKAGNTLAKSKGLAQHVSLLTTSRDLPHNYHIVEVQMPIQRKNDFCKVPSQK